MISVILIKINYFNNKLQETKNLTISEAKYFFKENLNKFSILNINIRSMNKNIDSLKSMLHNLNFSFKIICITETWCRGSENNSNYGIPGYTSIHQPRAVSQISNHAGEMCVSSYIILLILNLIVS